MKMHFLLLAMVCVSVNRWVITIQLLDFIYDSLNSLNSAKFIEKNSSKFFNWNGHLIKLPEKIVTIGQKQLAAGQ